MAERLERIEGTVASVIYRSEDVNSAYTVIELETEDDLTVVVGDMIDVFPGRYVEAEGTYVNHVSYGVQFSAEKVIVSLPADVNSILRFLAGGAVKGIGPATARKLVSVFGEDTLMVLETDRNRLIKEGKIPAKTADRIMREFRKLFGIQEAVKEMSEWGLSTSIAVKLFSTYRENAVTAFRENPYILCESPFFLPFRQVDMISSKMSYDFESAERITGGLIFIMRHNMDRGHTCLPMDKLLPTAAEYIRIEPERIADVIFDDARSSSPVFAVEEMDGRQFVYLMDLYQAEIVSAARLASLIGAEESSAGMTEKVERLERMLGVEYASNQKEAFEMAVTNRVSIITGGPGTGKTTLVRGLVELFESQGDVVKLCAPTGRAAKRLSEVTGRNASTIHRLLEVVPGSGNEQIRFFRNRENPILCDVLIVDEFSMVDTMLFSSLITSVRDSCRVILVGDHNQLPAVGPGNILKDLLDSGIVPSTELTEIFRQARESDIVMNAHAINRGEVPVMRSRNGDYFFLRKNDGFQEFVADLVSSRLVKSYGYSGYDDIQVLTPSRKGAGGTSQLNEYLQGVLNPPSEKKGQISYNGVTFRTGDKVMRVRNNYDIEYVRDDGQTDTGIFNGDIGLILSVDRRERSLRIRFEDRVCTYTEDMLGQLEHAWAVTVHKSQGSEFKAVVLCLNDVPSQLRYRNLIYTAFTRAKELLVAVGQEEVLAEMVSNNRKQGRYTGIRHFLNEFSEG